MEMDGTCFWWDGGFECVHNRPDPCKNPREIAHAVSEYYRIDISRKEAAVVGLGAFDEGNVTQGLILPPPSIGIQMRMRVLIDGKVYILQPEKDGAKSLMVYMDAYHPDYAIKISAKNFAFEDNKKIIPLYAAFCI